MPHPVPRWGRAAVALGLTLLLAPPLGRAVLRPGAAVGTLPPAVVGGTGAGGGSAPAIGGTITAVAGRIDAARWPVRLALPTLDVALPVEPVGLDADGDVAVPASPSRVGWDRRTAVPGSPGTAVLAAHVDSRVEGLGAFAGLVDLDPGAAVTLAAADGTLTRWRVVARESVAKERLPVDRLAALNGPPRLALVTCGGAFDPVARRYAENVIVWAVPDDPPAGWSPS